MNLLKTPKKVHSVKSARSNRSMKSMAIDGDCFLDFDDLVTNGCNKFNCPLKTVVIKEYRFDEVFKSKELLISAKGNKFSAAGSGKSIITPGSDKATKTDESDVRTDASIIDADTIVITAVHNNMNKICEISIRNQTFIPRVLMQIFGLVAPFFKYITKISLKKCVIDGYTIYEMVKFLSLTSITEICLDGSTLTESNYSLLLEKPCHITSLSLSRCKISDDDCRQIMSKLRVTEPAEETLTVLNLSSNHITVVGANSIGEALRTNRHLRYLNLADNRIGDDGANRIFHALIDFAMTYDEIVFKRQRYLEYLKERQDVFIKNVQAWDTKSIDNSFVSNKKGKMSKLPKVKKSKQHSIKPEMFFEDLASQFVDPFNKNNIILIDGYPHCIGNMVLCYLNLSYNNLSYMTLEKLDSVLFYQAIKKKIDQAGLLKVVIDGNPMPIACDKFEHISHMLQKNIIHFTPKTLTERKGRVGGTPGVKTSIASTDNIIGLAK